jgi:hypothetical protein
MIFAQTALKACAGGLYSRAVRLPMSCMLWAMTTDPRIIDQEMDVVRLGSYDLIALSWNLEL